MSLDVNEVILKKLEEHIISSKERHDGISKAISTLEERIEKTEGELFMWKTIIRVFKWIGGTILLLLTLRFGDVIQTLRDLKG